MYNLIDGKMLSNKIRGEIAGKVGDFKKRAGRDINLSVILVGEDSASQVYVRNKIKACAEVGINSSALYLP